MKSKLLFMNNKKNQRKTLSKFTIFMISAFLIFIASALITYKIIEKMHNNTDLVNNSSVAYNNKPVNAAYKKTQSETITEIIISSVGDCTLGYDSKFGYTGSFPYFFEKSGKDYSYFFKNTKSIFKADDITTANLETTFTDSTQRADKLFNFKAPASYAKILNEGCIEAVNISNNHIYDYGQAGFEDTKKALKANNIAYFGEGSTYVKEIKGIKLCFLGYRGFTYDNNFLKKVQNDIKNLKMQNCTVIVNFHWGSENAYYPDSVQKYLAHYAVDCGADLILGHHPHVIEGAEQYKNRFIFYSLGNFCFGGNFNPSDKDTFIVQSKLKYTDKILTSVGVRVIPCSISSVSNYNDYCPTVIEGNSKDALLAKLNKLSLTSDLKLSDKFIELQIQ